MARHATVPPTLDDVPTQPLPLDPIAEARRHWVERWGVGEHMAAATSLMRAHQLVLSAVEDVLRPYGLTFSSYEALMLLTFSRRGEMPLGKMSDRLMVHPASVTNTVDRLEERGLVRRRRDAGDGRRVLAVLTPAGRSLAEEVTGPLNDVCFGLASIAEADAARINAILRQVREAGGDIAAHVDDPWARQIL
jgi:DNA-binding MarR family transcriptional regulator